MQDYMTWLYKYGIYVAMNNGTLICLIEGNAIVIYNESTIYR